MFSIDLTKFIDWLLSFLKWKKQKGIVAEWMEPEWFKFGGSSYSNYVPTSIIVWLQVYFRNTTNESQILQSAQGSFERNGRFWGGGFRFVATKISSGWFQENQADFPKTIHSNDALLLYFNFMFQPDGEAVQFIDTLKNAPILKFKITYVAKENGKTKQKQIERDLDFKNEYKNLYKSFLGDYFQGQNINPNNENQARLLKIKQYFDQEIK